MNNTEIALKYGVPMPETCAKFGEIQRLDDIITSIFETEYNESKTLFIWVYVNNGFEIYEYESYMENPYCPSEIKMYAAPQVHELLPILQKQAPLLRLCYSEDQGDHFLHFGTFIPENDTWVKIENNHYAEACANLYLQRKEKGLI